MRLNSTKILNISITTSSRQIILEEIQKYLTRVPNPKSQITKKDAKPLVIVTPNPEQIVLASKNQQFAGLLNQADISLPDGIGVVWANRILDKSSNNSDYRETLRQIQGVGFMEDLVALAAKEGVTTALIGGRGGLAVKALECLRQKHSGLKGWGEDGPELEVKSDLLHRSAGRASVTSCLSLIASPGREEEYIEQLATRIKETNVKFVFVGLGAPKQEFLIEGLASSLSLSAYQCVFMAVGGSFDEVAGRVQRSPDVVNALGVKWLWRLVHEPWRWRRQLALITFVLLVLREKMK